MQKIFEALFPFCGWAPILAGKTVLIAPLLNIYNSSPSRYYINIMPYPISLFLR